MHFVVMSMLVRCHKRFLILEVNSPVLVDPGVHRVVVESRMTLQVYCRSWLPQLVYHCVLTSSDALQVMVAWPCAEHPTAHLRHLGFKDARESPLLGRTSVALGSWTDHARKGSSSGSETVRRALTTFCLGDAWRTCHTHHASRITHWNPNGELVKK